MEFAEEFVSPLADDRVQLRMKRTRQNLRGRGSGMSITASPGTQVVTGELHRVRHGHGKQFSAEPLPKPSRRPARVAVTLALAHMIQRAIDRGEIRDQAEAARGPGLTRARLTQILDLTLLAPQLQEEILLLEAVEDVEPLTERTLRDAVRTRMWEDQKSVFPLHIVADRRRRSPGCGQSRFLRPSR